MEVSVGRNKDSKWNAYTLWCYVLLITTLYNAILCPIQIARLHGCDGFCWFWIDTIFDLVYVVDIVLNICSFRNKLAVFEHKSVKQQKYTDRRFWEDVAATLPLEVLCFGVGVQYRPLLRMNRNLRLVFFAFSLCHLTHNSMYSIATFPYPPTIYLIPLQQSPTTFTS